MVMVMCKVVAVVMVMLVGSRSAHEAIPGSGMVTSPGGGCQGGGPFFIICWRRCSVIVVSRPNLRESTNSVRSKSSRAFLVGMMIEFFLVRFVGGRELKAA